MNYRASSCANAGFDLGSTCFVRWNCFSVVFNKYFLEEVLHGCLATDNLECVSMFMVMVCGYSEMGIAPLALPS